VGKEWKLVVQGGFREDSGRIFRRGDLCISDPETTHDLTALPEGPPLIYLVVLMEGFEIAGMFIGPEDARF
jgi:anti-sigma factor ChrR (cupin superfamily)